LFKLTADLDSFESDSVLSGLGTRSPSLGASLGGRWRPDPIRIELLLLQKIG